MLPACFFSSRRRHTRLQGDWSSDVCSSDLSRRGSASSTRCTSRPRSSSTTTSRACTPTLRSGWRNWPLRNRTASTRTTGPISPSHFSMSAWLEKLAPEKPHSQYAHNRGEDNADAHLKRTIMGREVVVAVTEGRLDFGPWEQIFYGEFDGMRRKRVLVKIVGD